MGPGQAAEVGRDPEAALYGRGTELPGGSGALAVAGPAAGIAGISREHRSGSSSTNSPTTTHMLQQILFDRFSERVPRDWNRGPRVRPPSLPRLRFPHPHPCSPRIPMPTLPPRPPATKAKCDEGGNTKWTCSPLEQLARGLYYAPFPALTVDAEGRVLDYNLALGVLAGDELNGRRYFPLEELVGAVGAPRDPGNLASRRRRCGSNEMHLRLPKGSGRSTWWARKPSVRIRLPARRSGASSPGK